MHGKIQWLSCPQVKRVGNPSVKPSERFRTSRNDKQTEKYRLYKQTLFKGELIMSIITISRGSYSKGKEVAEKIAQKLGYECIARDTIIESSKEFNIPEIKLIRAIHDAPSILERFNCSKEKYLAYLHVNMLEHFPKDNVVYHGLAGHFFIKNISHVLKVRIIADMEDRV